MDYSRALLGRTGREVCRLGLAASYGVPAAAVEEAFDAGINYMFWGSRRTGAFGQGLRALARHRERMVLVIQSYSRLASLVGWSLERALGALRQDYADVLLLGLWNRPVAPRILEAAIEARERGRTRFLAVSTHRRPLAAELAAESAYDIFHLRYNAVHRGAEGEVFARLPAAPAERPGVVSFTATSWRQLLGSRRIPPSERTPTAGDCYRFVLAQPQVDVCLVGAASAEHVRHALEALRRGPMSEDELAWMRRVGDAIYRR